LQKLEIRDPTFKFNSSKTINIKIYHITTTLNYMQNKLNFLDIGDFLTSLTCEITQNG